MLTNGKISKALLLKRDRVLFDGLIILQRYPDCKRKLSQRVPNVIHTACVVSEATEIEEVHFLGHLSSIHIEILFRFRLVYFLLQYYLEAIV